MTSAWLDNWLARGEQPGELGKDPWGPDQVEASSKYQYWRAERSERCTGGRSVKCSLGGEGVGSILVGLLLSGSPVSLGGGVPAAIAGRADGSPAAITLHRGQRGRNSYLQVDSVCNWKIVVENG